MFLRRFRRKGDFGVRRNWEGSGSCVLMSVRDMDVLRLLCWCQNVRPDDLSSISTETERENLITLGLIKRHQRSDTLLLTNSGRAFLQAALEGDVPNLTLSYHDAAIERRVRLSSLMMTAYHAGINVFTIRRPQDRPSAFGSTGRYAGTDKGAARILLKRRTA